MDNDGDGVRVCDGDCNDNDVTCHQDGDACCIDCTDVDGDGYGEGVDCTGPDCDDNDAERNSGLSEACDGKDNDCNGVVPHNEDDIDNDGVRICEGDCNDNDANCSPVGDACCPDCLDEDQDGYGQGPDCLGPDCNDDDPNCNMGQCCAQQCIDDDGDGYGLGADCLGSDCNDNNINCWTGACCPAGENCRAVISCVQNCQDQACIDACYAQGDADAQALMDEIFDCIATSGCVQDDWTCIGQTCWQPMLACMQDIE